MARRGRTHFAATDVAQSWLRSGSHASLDGIALLPQENKYLPKGTPLVVARGQAQAFHLRGTNKQVWILKKFLPGRNPDAQYIRAIQTLVPRHAGFESGYLRKVLTPASAQGPGLPAGLPEWIENTILMPLVRGSDWAHIADMVREGKISLTPEQRLQMCRSLGEKVGLLESNELSHRDLSSTNIFIDTDTWDVHLIDWDSLFHPTLTRPPNTTFGTTGYIAPFVRAGGVEDPRVTWGRNSDRFSMGVLCVEFLCVGRKSPVTGDGGLLDQDEIYNGGGGGISQIIPCLRQSFPNALALFEKILRARTFGECPGPAEWKALGADVSAPSLKDVYDPQADFLNFLQRTQKMSTPATPAPNLSDVAAPDFEANNVNVKADASPAAPSLSDLKAPDLAALLRRGGPSGRGATPQAAPEAPSLSEVENPFADANKNGGNQQP